MNEKNEQQEIETSVVVMPEVQTNQADALEIIERRNALFERVMAVAVSSTSFNDWVDQAGKPYLQASGAEKCARRFGVSVFDTSIEREDLSDDNGRYYLYTVTGKAQLGNEMIEAIGTCSSRDKFFGTVRGELKAIQDVDIANIKKKAYTNFLGNAVRKLLGLNNLTWDDLAKHGINRSGKASVSYDKGASKAVSSKQSAYQESKAKKPFWTSDWNGQTYVNARVGNHFTSEFLENIGLKKGKKEGLFYSISNDQILDALENEYMTAEEMMGGEL